MGPTEHAGEPVTNATTTARMRSAMNPHAHGLGPANGSAREGTVDPVSQEYLARAVRIATDNVGRAGGPFGALLVTADGRVFEGVNRVTADHDPSAHAEVTAIRTACRELATFDLTGAVLYSSCEPCPMCLATALWARVARVEFAADRYDAADAGFDDAAFYRYFEGGPADRGAMPVAQRSLPGGQHTAPFGVWSAHASRVEY